MSEPAPRARPRRWWLALLLNLIVPPTGYAYVGSWTAVWVTFGAVVLGSVAASEWTLLHPPGIYAFGDQGLLVSAAVGAVLLGVHAAWMATRAAPRTGTSRAINYVAPWFLLLVLNLVLKAFWPYPVYTASTESMLPTLSREDFVLAEGARASCGETRPKPGDVVVYRRDALPYLARVVAGPGQTVGLHEGLLAIDGKAVARRALGSVPVAGLAVRATVVEETLPGGARYRTYDLGPDGPLDEIAPTTVPAGSWYLMGDSRDNSADLRSFGPVKGAEVCAVVIKIVTHKDKSRVGQKP